MGDDGYGVWGMEMGGGNGVVGYVMMGGCVSVVGEWANE